MKLSLLRLDPLAEAMAVLDVHELLVQFRGTEAKDLESFRLLTCAFQEQCEIVEGREEPLRVREPNEIPCDSVMSPADPDVSYNARRGAGYLVQVMETFSEEDDPQLPNDGPALPDLITHVAVGKMTVHDRSALEPALEETAQPGVQPEDLLADSHYGSNECVQKAQAHGTQVISPAMPAKGKGQDRLTLEDFELDDEGRILRCPEGHVPLETSIAEVRLQVQFDPAVCAKCPQRQGNRMKNCPVSRGFHRQVPADGFKTVTQRARKPRETCGFRADFMRLPCSGSDVWRRLWDADSRATNIAMTGCASGSGGCRRPVKRSGIAIAGGPASRRRSPG